MLNSLIYERYEQRETHHGKISHMDEDTISNHGYVRFGKNKVAAKVRHGSSGIWFTIYQLNHV